MQEKSENQIAKSANKYLLSIKKTYERFVKIRGNPREIALGFALGLFIGMTPYMGIQMVIAVCLAAILKWNKISAAMGVWISNPLTAPLIYSITYYIGKKTLGIETACCLPETLELDIIIAIIKQAPEIFWILTVGGIILGIPLALAGYHLSFSAILRYREEIRRKIAEEKKKLANTRNKIKTKIKRRKKRRR
ncbi:DUF2062 domain-containing protein [Desulfonema ishimotonii]|uniref:DUF2062 domain-containing protein n=1 Tax=Desulfonema ishimotonii TaxID=45657 RepID=A0A401G376_9BACT|nr:DUF2062 domain-containing protein [Desulfonema ishimotonii]GBC63702.1 DUF2062 domain-containing protein [Desulfonema ishimotonii]